MAIYFHPSPGCVLLCNFEGYIFPEIVKVRPVVIVSPKHLKRGDLHCVVPLSTTPPDHIEPYHYQLKKDPIPNSNATVWAKCDLVATVCSERFDRFQVGRRAFKTSGIPAEELEAIRECIKYALGIK